MASGNTSSKVQKTLAPQNMSTPFGALSTKGKSTVYQPYYKPGQEDILNNAYAQAGNILNNDLPQLKNQYEGTLSNFLGNTNNLTADNIVNPQMYNAIYGLLANPLKSQYQDDLNSLEGNLAAQNLSGGSYDALSHSLLNKNLGLNLGQAANSAVGQGLAATGDYLGLQNQGVNTAAAGLPLLGNLASQYQTIDTNLQNQLMAPFGQFTNYQNAITPLQEQQANYMAQTPTGFQQVMGALGGTLNAVVPGIGAPFVGLGNAFGNPYAAGQYPYGGSGNNTLGAIGQFFHGGNPLQNAGSSTIPGDPGMGGAGAFIP